MTMTTVTTAQMVCDECGRRGPEFVRGDRSKQAAREFARAAAPMKRTPDEQRAAAGEDRETNGPQEEQ